MADKYWVGGTGTWNTTLTTNWRTTSGGTTVAAVPTAADNVIFDANSGGTFTVTMTGALACLSITVATGVAATFVTGTTPTLTVAASMSLGSSTVWSTTGTTTFTATTSQTINTNGVTISSPFTFNGTGGTWTLQNNLTLATTATTTLTAGTLALSTFTLSTGAFSSASAVARTISFGTGKIVLTTAATNTIWNTSTITGLTISGTPLVECQGGGTAVTKTINTGVLSEANAISFSLLETTGTATYAFTSTNTVKNLIVNGSQTLSNIAITIYGSFTHLTTNGTTTFTAGVSSWTLAATSGNFTITPASSIFLYDFPWIFGGGSASTATWTLQNILNIGTAKAISFLNGILDLNNYNFTGGVSITMLNGTFTLNNTGGTVFLTSLPITHTSGTLNLGTTLTTTAAAGYTFTAGTLSLGSFILNTPIFSSSNANARTLAFGTGKIVINSAVTSTVWTTATVTGLTVTGTSLVEFKGGGTAVTKTINTGTLTESQAINFSLIETTGTATYTFTAGNAVKNLIINGVQTISNIAITIYGTLTHTTTNGTTTFTAGTNAWTFGATSGNYTITNIAAFAYDFPWVFGAAASTATWTLAANLTLGAAKALTLTNGTLDINNKTITSIVGITIVTGSATLNNTGGTLLSVTVPITHTSGTLTLGTNLTTSSTYTLTAGTLSLVTFTLTTTTFVSNNANVRGINFGSGQLALTGSSATIFDVTTATNFTSSGVPYINSTYTGSTGTRTIVTGFTETQSQGYDVYFSAAGSGIVLSASATDTIALTGGFRNLNFTGFTGTLSNTARTLYGNLTIPSSGGTYTAGALVTTFGVTSASPLYSTGINITTNSRTLDFPFTFNGTGGIFNLVGNLTSSSTRTSTLTAGTLNLNNYILSTGLFSNSGAVARTLAFGTSGQLNLNGTGTVFDATTATNLTTTGTVYVNTSSVSGTKTIVTGFTESQAAGYSVATSGTSGIILNTADVITLTGSFFSIDLTSFAGTLVNTARTIYGSWTNPSTGGTYTPGTVATTFAATTSQNITGNGRVLDFPFTFNGVGGTWTLQTTFACGSTRTTTLTAGTLNLSTFSYTTGLFSSSGAVARTVAYGTGQLILNGAGTIFDTTTATNFSSTGRVNVNASSVSGTKTIVTGFTESQAAGYSVATSGTIGFVINTADVITLTGSFFSIDLTSFAGTLSNTARTVYGSWTNPASGGTYTAGALVTTFAATTSQTITGNARSLGFPFTFNGVGGSWALQTNFTVTSTLTTTLTAGTLNLNNYILSTGLFSSSGAVARTVAYGTGQLALSGTGTVFDTTTATNFSSTGTVYVNAAATSGTKTIVTGFNETQAAGYSVAIAASNGISINSADVITLTGGFNDFNLTSFAGTLANTARTIYGNWTTPTSGGTYTVGTVATTFGATSSKTITSNGRTLDFALTFDGVGGTWTLQDNLTIGATRILTWNNGTLDLNNKTLSTPVSITVNGGATGSFRLNNTGGTQAYTTTVALTHTSGELYFNYNYSFGAYTWTAGTITLNSYTLTCTTFTSTSTTARTFAFGTGNLTVTASGACFNMLGATNQVITGTPTVNITNSTTTATSVVPGAVTEAQSLNFNFNPLSAVAYTLTFLATAGHTARSVSFGNYFIGTWAAVAACTIYGSFYGPSTTYGTPVITASASVITFGGTGLFGNKTVTTNGVSLAFPVNFNGVGSYWYTGAAFRCDATHGMTFTNGNLSGENLTSAITALSFTMVTGTFSLNMANFGSTAFTHTSGSLTITGIDNTGYPVYQTSSGFISGVYTFTAGTLIPTTTVEITSFISNGLVARTLFPGYTTAGGTSYGSFKCTGSGTVWNTSTLTGYTYTSGNYDLYVYVTNATTTATSVLTGAMTEAQSLSFVFSGGAYALTFLGTAGYTAKNVDFTNFIGTWGLTAACTIYGSMDLGSSMTLTESASVMTFAGTTGNIYRTITPAGLSIKFPMTFNSTTDQWTLQGALTMGATAARALVFINGSFNIQSYTISAGFAGSTMSVNTGTVYLYDLYYSTIPFTLTSGTLTLDRIYNSYVFMSSSFTHTAGTLNLNIETYIQDVNNVTPYTYTFTAGTINLNDWSLVLNKFAATGATTRTITFGTSGTNYILVYPLAASTAWDQTTIGTFSRTGNPNVIIDTRYIPSPYTAVTTIVPGAATITNAMNFTIQGNNNNELITILGTASNAVRDLSFNTTLTWNNAIAATCTVFGSMYVSSGTTTTESANALTLGATAAYGTALFDFQGLYVKFPITFNGVGGTFQLVNSFYMGATVARAITLVNGTLDLNGYQIFLGFAGSTMSTNTNTVSIINAHGGIYLPFTITSGICSIRGDVGLSSPAYFISTFTFTAGTMTLSSDVEIVGAFTYTAGTINLSTYHLQLDTSYVASGATTRVINFGSGSYIQVSPTTTSTAWNAATIGTFSYTGTSDVRINAMTLGNVYTISTGAATEAQAMNFSFFGEFYSLATTGSVFKNLYLNVYTDNTNYGTWTVGAITIYGNFTETGYIGFGDRYLRRASSASVITFAGATGSKTIDTRGIEFFQPITFNGALSIWQLQSAFASTGTNGTVTLTAGTLQLNVYYIVANIFNASGSTARTIDFGTSSWPYNPAIVVKGNGTPFTTATATNLTLSGTYPLVQVAPTSPSGTITIAGSGTEAQSFNYWFYNGDNGASYTLNFLGTAGYTAKDVDFGDYYSGFSGTWAATSTCIIYGSFYIGPVYAGTMTLTTSASAMTFGGTSGTKEISTNGISLPFPITFNGAGSTFQLTTSLSLSTVALTTTHTNGILDLNGYTLTTGIYATAVGTKNITFNGGTLQITGSGATAFNNANPTNFTTTAGTGTGTISMSSATAKTFVGANFSYNCNLSNDGAGALTISGSNSFQTITNGVSPTTFTFTAATTQTVTGWTVNGTAGNLVALNSSTAGTLANISKTGGGYMDYVSVKDLAFQPCTTDGSGALPNLWYGGANSTNLGNIFGIVLQTYSSTAILRTYTITSTSITSWTVPADWNSGSNIVHLIGAGGGGGASRETTQTNKTGGGGGGGGGYTKITNYSPGGSSIAVAVGIGGTGGAATSGAAGTAGGTTTFGSSSAAGGAGGTTTTTPSGPGGAGGVGSTYNGGTGGNGGATTSTGSDTGGGGGGGSAGPNGNGGAGGNGFAAGLGVSAGGGGGGNGGGTAGGNAASSTFGPGGNGYLGTGRGATSGAAGTIPTGGGGAGSFGAGASGGAGAIGADILNTWGGSGGAGGSSRGAAGVSDTLRYGGGGSGGAQINGAGQANLAGGNGGGGLIVIQYYVGTSSSTGAFFAFF